MSNNFSEVLKVFKSTLSYALIALLLILSAKFVFSYDEYKTDWENQNQMCENIIKELKEPKKDRQELTIKSIKSIAANCGSNYGLYVFFPTATRLKGRG